jgi:hypothetical protein
MTLRARLESIPETLQEFDLALEERFREGQVLVNSGNARDASAGIYLLGYAAEMLLKGAYFRFEGAAPGDLIAPRLGPARAAGRRLIPAIPYENYHSLLFWAKLLQVTRVVQGQPLPFAVAVPFLAYARRLHGQWWVEMRYRRNEAHAVEARSVLADVIWLRANRFGLWR